jgi:cation transport ATPase
VALVIEAKKVGRDTMLSQIVQLVAEAQRSRAPIQRLADQVSGWFVPTVIAVSLLAFAAWGIWGPAPQRSLWEWTCVRQGSSRSPIRQGVDPQALAGLKAEGIRVVARKLGFDEVEAEVLPDQKAVRCPSGHPRLIPGAIVCDSRGFRILG